MTAPLAMAALPAVAARPAAGVAKPAEAAADTGDGQGFAAALEVARRPAQGEDATEPRTDAGTQRKSDDGEAIDDPAEAGDAAAIDLTLLLTGWPAVPTPVSSVPAVAAPAAGTASAPDAVPAALVVPAASTVPAAGTVPGAGTAREHVADVSAVLASVSPSGFVPGFGTDKGTDTVAGTAAGSGAGTTVRAERGDDRASTAPGPAASAAVMTPISAAHDPASRSTPVASEALPSKSGSTARGADAPSAAALTTASAPMFIARDSAPSPAPAQTPFEVRLAAALESPAFAPALATQVKWLVHEGVQQARLSLNPAEMGPVAVQIVVNGTQARVDFSAEMAATRAAIEASLSTLAAALHDSGLTLAGGGVFDGQPRHGAQRQDQGAPAQGRAASATPSAAAGHTAAAPVRAARGLVDLIA